MHRLFHAAQVTLKVANSLILMFIWVKPLFSIEEHVHKLFQATFFYVIVKK